MQNWNAWNRTVLIFKLRAYANWIVWIRTVYLYKNGFGIKLPIKDDMP